ncbi:MAG: RagB/SusD family nutrient uptake outer membrane protein [Bacteroides sp.]|nr:RagB/SusD family nutrient uptake outer membrane protein [Bacteroides sp.]
MKKYIKSLIAGVLIGTGFLSTSCNSELELTPEDYFSAYSFWGSRTEFEGFISAVSNQFRENYPANILFYAGELRAGTLELTTIDGSGILNSDYIQNIYSESKCQFDTFGKYYGFIGNLNELIYRCDNTTILTDEVKNGLLAIAYG